MILHYSQLARPYAPAELNGGIVFTLSCFVRPVPQEAITTLEGSTTTAAFPSSSSHVSWFAAQPR